MRMIFGFVACVAMVAGLCGCAPPDVAGSWSGSWNVGLFSNSLTMNLTQSDTSVQGSSTVGGTFCVPNGNVTATVDAGKNKLHGSFTNNVGTVSFDADINVSATHLSGTFTATGLGCGSGTTGTFAMDKQGG